MDELRFLRFLPGAVLGLVIGINADRFIWPHAVRLVPERIIRAIIRIKDKCGIKCAPGEDKSVKGNDKAQDPHKG